MNGELLKTTMAMLIQMSYVMTETSLIGARLRSDVTRLCYGKANPSRNDTKLQEQGIKLVCNLMT